MLQWVAHPLCYCLKHVCSLMSAQIGPVAYAFAFKGKRDRWCPLLAIIRHLKGVFKSWSSYFKSDRDGEDKIEFRVTCLNGQSVSTRFGLIKSSSSALEELFLLLFQREGMLCCTRCCLIIMERQLMNSCLFLHHFMYLMYVCYFLFLCISYLHWCWSRENPMIETMMEILEMGWLNQHNKDTK